MASDALSPPGSASYSSNTMTVGDGTWDFTKNSFLLPNLVGLNFETMQYNGMANRFATIPQYHTIILAHGVIAAMAFLFIVPAAVMTARFYHSRPGYAIRYHAYLNVLAVLLITVVFILGFFAVGPSRALTNPHHGIGVAIYVLILLQAIGGRLVKNITRARSLRVTVHQWSGRAIAILGIVQVPLGLTLYGSPKYLFVLYTLWMTFLFLLYFIFSYRSEGRRELFISGGRSEGGEVIVEEHKERRSGMMRWLGPLAAGAGIFALLRRNRDKERSRSRSRSHSRARSRSSGRREVVSSRRGSDSFVEEKYTEHRDHGRDREGGGFMNKVLTAGAAVGAGALLSRFMNRRERRHDEEYSAVETDTPSRRSRLRKHHPTAVSEISEVSEAYSGDGRRTPLLPAPNPVLAAQALSAAESRPVTSRPRTPPRHHRPGHSRVDSGIEHSDYSSYVSPSRRTPPPKSGGGGVAKGLLAGIGLGWFAKKMGDRRNKREEERLRIEEEDRRSGYRGSRYTGDGYPTPSRRESRRHSRPPPALSGRGTTVTGDSEISSSTIEPRPAGMGHGGPPMPPLGPTGVPIPAGYPVSGSRTQSRLRHEAGEPVDMPPIPADPHGILHRDSASEVYDSSGYAPRRRDSSRRRAAGAEAAAAAMVSASRLAAAEERRRRDHSTPPAQAPVSVKVKMHDDRDRKVTLRRLTPDEAAATRREARRERNDSVSSFSGPDTPTARRYRRDASAQRRAEAEAERLVDEPLSPPNPAYARRKAGKDSAYYSGQPGPSGGVPAAGVTASSLGSPESHGTWSAMSGSPNAPGRPEAGSVTASAADRRRRRRLERRETGQPVEVEFT